MQQKTTLYPVQIKKTVPAGRRFNPLPIMPCFTPLRQTRKSIQRKSEAGDD
ncbi:Uncharacterised protein [Serratia rubidaea]|nr:Uncharacterised protein [Serratia rubidaea]